MRTQSSIQLQENVLQVDTSSNTQYVHIFFFSLFNCLGKSSINTGSIQIHNWNSSFREKICSAKIDVSYFGFVVENVEQELQLLKHTESAPQESLREFKI